MRPGRLLRRALCALAATGLFATSLLTGQVSAQTPESPATGMGCEAVSAATPVAGGMMHFGIPKYRLPREVLAAEVDRIRALGVEIRVNEKVEDLLADKAAGRFDAVFLAVGAHLSKRQEIPARDAGRIYDAIEFLKDVELGSTPPTIGRRVAIYGGGNTAMDAARTARRMAAVAATFRPNGPRSSDRTVGMHSYPLGPV